MTVIAAQEKLADRSRPLFSDSAVHFALFSLLLVVVAVAVYWPVHTHPFMPADDNFYVVDNVHVHAGLRWSTVKWAFTATDMVNWIPLTWLAHAADYEVFGSEPAGHHLVNVLLHALAVVLLFWTMKRATGFLGRSFMVAALFALHPINVESVAWVAELKTMLSMIFLLLTLDCYRRYAANPGFGRYSLVALFYSLGLMAKSQIIMLPFVLLLWDYWPLQRMFAVDSAVVEGTNALPPKPARSFLFLVKEKVPLFALALLDAAITLHVQGAARASRWNYTLSIRTANALVAYVRYLAKAFWPQWLSIRYSHPGNALPVWQIAGAAALLLAITILVLSTRHRRYLLVGWLWFLVSLLPMSGIIDFGDQAMADRYAYQPLCGLFIIVCWSVAEWFEQRHVSVALLAGISAAILGALTALTYRQVNYWRDDLTLWSHALQVSADNPFTESRVAFDLIGNGRTAEGMQHLARVVSLNPHDAKTSLILAFYEHQHGDLRTALDYYQRVLDSPATSPAERRQVLINMGHIYGDLGDSERARQYFHAAANVTLGAVQ